MLIPQVRLVHPFGACWTPTHLCQHLQSIRAVAVRCPDVHCPPLRYHQSLFPQAKLRIHEANQTQVSDLQSLGLGFMEDATTRRRTTSSLVSCPMVIPRKCPRELRKEARGHQAALLEMLCEE